MDRREVSLMDMPTEMVIQKLNFLDEEYVRFWLANQDFRLEYKRLYAFGFVGHFYKFYQAAVNVLAEMSASANTEFQFDTAIKSIRKMEKLMNGGYDDRLFNRKLMCVLNKLSAPGPSIKYWLTVPEFVSEMMEYVAHNKVIDDKIALESMERIYSAKQKEQEIHRDKGYPEGYRQNFNCSFARKAIKSIRKALGLPPPPPANDPESVSVSE